MSLSNQEALKPRTPGKRLQGQKTSYKVIQRDSKELCGNLVGECTLPSLPYLEEEEEGLVGNQASPVVDGVVLPQTVSLHVYLEASRSGASELKSGYDRIGST